MGCRGHIWDIRGHIWDAEDTESPGCDARVQCYFKYLNIYFFIPIFVTTFVLPDVLKRGKVAECAEPPVCDPRTLAQLGLFEE